jgi:hypothetical protein
MAGLRGNVAWILAQKQASKGVVPTPTTANAYKMPLTGGGIGPSRETDNLSETDASRDQGKTYIVSTGVEGSPEMYVRDASAGFWLFAALGADAVTGATDFTHVLTPANVLPYVCVWRMIGDTLYEQFRDCKVGSLSISAEAGQPLTMTAGIMGLQSTRLTAAPDQATPIPVQNGAVYSYNDATVTLGGGATALVSSFELTIENNMSTQQTDNVVPYDVSEAMRTVTLGFDMIFETLDEYNKFMYGGAAGTSVSSEVFTTSALFEFSKGANNSIGFNLPSIAYTEFPVEANPAGDPIVVSVAATAQRTGSAIVTATVKNQVATY